MFPDSISFLKLEQCKRFSHPVHPRAAHPSLCSVGVVWVGKQTADTLRYFLAPHQLSFFAFAPYLDVRATLGSRFGFFFPFLPSWAFLRWSLLPKVAGLSGNISTLRDFGFDPMEAADCGSAGRRLTALWTDEPPGAPEPSCSSDRRAGRAQQTADRPTNMSGGEILFQGWLRKSPPEKKLRRYVSNWDFCRVLLFWIESNDPESVCPCSVGHVRLWFCQPGNEM